MSTLSDGLKAKDKGTKGPFDVVFAGTMGKYSLEKVEKGVHKQLAYCGYYDAIRFAATPDALEWISKALPWLKYIKANANIDAYLDPADLAALIAQVEGR